MWEWATAHPWLFTGLAFWAITIVPICVAALAENLFKFIVSPFRKEKKDVPQQICEAGKGVSNS